MFCAVVNLVRFGSVGVDVKRLGFSRISCAVLGLCLCLVIVVNLLWI